MRGADSHHFQRQPDEKEEESFSVKKEESQCRRKNRAETEEKNSGGLCQKSKLKTDVHKRQESNLEQINESEKKERVVKESRTRVLGRTYTVESCH
jgi:hypothetical protein